MSRGRADAEGDGPSVRPCAEPRVKLFGVTLGGGENLAGAAETLRPGDSADDLSMRHLRRHGAGIATHLHSPLACPPAFHQESGGGRLAMRSPGPPGIPGPAFPDSIPAGAGVLVAGASPRQELGGSAAEQGAGPWGKDARPCRFPARPGVQELGRRREAAGRSREADQSKLLSPAGTAGEQRGEDLSDNDWQADPPTCASKERRKGIPWSAEEHRLFLLGLQELGKGDWRGISRKFVLTRTPTQVASHAQKYFIRQANQNKRKRRASLLDIGTESLAPDSKMPRSVSAPTLPRQDDSGRTDAITAAPGSIIPLPRSPARSATPRRVLPKEPWGCVETSAYLHQPANSPGVAASFPAAAPLGLPDCFPPQLPEQQLMPCHDSSHPQENRLACKLPNMDIGRTQSYPAVGAVGASEDAVVGLVRPCSMPLIGSHLPGPRHSGSPEAPRRPALDGASESRAALCANYLEGRGCSSGTLEAHVPSTNWTLLHRGFKAADDRSSEPGTAADTMVVTGPGAKHRLGHDMIAGIVSCQVGQPRSAAAASSRAGVLKPHAGPSLPWAPGALVDMEPRAQGRKEAARGSPQGYRDKCASGRASCSPSGKACSILAPVASAFRPVAPDGVARPQAVQSAWQAVRLSPVPVAMTSPFRNPAEAAASAASTAAAGATTKPPEAGAGHSACILPWLPLEAWVPRHHQFSSYPECTAPATPLPLLPQPGPSAPAQGRPGRAADTAQGKAPQVLHPSAVLPSAPHAICGVRLGAAGHSREARTAPYAPNREGAGTLMLLGEGIGEAEGPSPGDAAAEAREDIGRETPVTLELFGVSRQPSAFDTQARVSPEATEVGQTPISVL